MWKRVKGMFARKPAMALEIPRLPPRPPDVVTIIRSEDIYKPGEEVDFGSRVYRITRLLRASPGSVVYEAKSDD
jgi:hypothetical protein